MSNHITFLSWKGNRGVPNCQMKSGSMIMLWGLPLFFLLNRVFPHLSPAPAPALEEQHKNTKEALTGTVKCLLLILKLLLVSCSAKDLSHLLPARCLLFSLLLSLPQGMWRVCLPQSPARAESWEWAALPGEGMGYKQGEFGFSDADLPVPFCSDCSGSFLAPLQKLFSSWKLGGRVFSSAGAGWMMHVVNWSWIIGRKVTGAWLWLHHTQGSLGAAHLSPLPVLLPMCSAGCPALSPSLLLILLRGAEDHRAGRSCSCASAEEAGEASERMIVSLQGAVKYQVICYTVDLH